MCNSNSKNQITLIVEDKGIITLDLNDYHTLIEQYVSDREANG